MSKAAGRNVPPERIANEHMLIRKDAPNFSIVGRDMTHYFGFVSGLGIYEGGVFPLELEMSENYPFDPPIVTLWSKIWHPNIVPKNPPLITHWVGGKSVHWDICVNIITKDWLPGSNLLTIIREFQLLLSLFDSPEVRTAFNPRDPLNLEAAIQYMRKPSAFKRKAREWVQQHATWEHFCAERNRIMSSPPR
jgi:ubiquitin-protein ligase